LRDFIVLKFDAKERHENEYPSIKKQKLTPKINKNIILSIKIIFF
jgi:hypothetical protein